MSNPQLRGRALLDGKAGPVDNVLSYTTPIGTILLQNHCSAELVEQLCADTGLRAFARNPEREHQLLLHVARQPECRLALAYTPDGKIVGQMTLAPVDDWWQDLKQTYEMGIEVSTQWRRCGIARQLLAQVFTDTVLEQWIILGLGLSWHWDLEGTGLSPFDYRKFLAEQSASYGFAEYMASEPNLTMSPANILLARIGSNVSLENINQFFSCLLRSDPLSGLA